MPTRPLTYPRWADVGGGAGVSPAPSSGKMDTGWAVAEKPAAQHLNYLHNLQYQWHKYLDEALEGFALANLASRTSGFGATDIKAIAYGNNTLVCVGSAGKTARSTDGVSWTEQALGGGTPNFVKVIYANGLFAALADNKTVWTSPDGATWTSRALPAGLAGSPRGIAFGANAWVVVYSADDGATDTATSGIAYSPDCGTVTAFVTKNSGQGGAPGLLKLVFANNLFVVAGDDGSAFPPAAVIVSTSADGITWTARNTGLIASGAGAGAVPILGFGAGLWVLSDNGHIVTSPNAGATAWTDRGAVGGGAAFKDVVWSGSLFVAVGTNGATYTSPDGITWTSRTNTFSTDTINRVIWTGKYFVCCGANGKASSSLDGITWGSRALGLSTNAINDVTFTAAPAPPDYVFVGAAGSISSSLGMT
jgi:hypothetical protein